MEIVNKFLTYGYRKITNPNHHDLHKKLLKQQETGMYKECGYSIYKAPQSILVLSKDVEFFMVAFEESLKVCLVVNDRVYFWSLGSNYSYFEYENFMYQPKYKVLANFIYNLYYSKEKYHFKDLYQDRPWKLFKSHMAFSPDCKLGDKGATFIYSLHWCIRSYGKEDQENITNQVIRGLEPWTLKNMNDINILKNLTGKMNIHWNIIEAYLSGAGNIHTFEKLLYQCRFQFLDEPYKLLDIAFVNDNPALYTWILNRYKVDKKRIKHMLPLYVSNFVTDIAKNI